MKKEKYTEFLNEDNIQEFYETINSCLKDDDIQKIIKEKQQKYKTFTIKTNTDKFSKFGFTNNIVFKFKSVKNSDDFDIDVTFIKNE